MTKRSKTSKPTNTEPHEAGCACGPCHNERTSERAKPQPKLPPEACGVQDGSGGRRCALKAGHNGHHFTGLRTFRDPPPPSAKPKRAKKPAPSPQSEAMVAPHVCANAACDPSSGKPLKGALAKSCEREPGHEGPHRIGPHGDLEHVVEWEDGKPGWVSYNRKAQRPMTLDDEPEDSEADNAALAAMDAEARNELGDADAIERADLEPEEDGDEDPRPQWLREQTEQRDAAGRGAPAELAPEDDEDDDARDLARQHREAREAHAAELAGAEVGAQGRMDGKDCGAIGPKGTACVLDNGHDAEHRDYMGRTWVDRKPRATEPQKELFARPATADEPAEEEDARALMPRTGETITCRGKVYAVHPAARPFPTTVKKFRSMVASIRATGQIHEVELLGDLHGPVIDGCNRLVACEELGIEPRIKVVSVADPVKYVIAVNIERRQMTESQLGAVGAELCTLEHGANQHTARTGTFAAPTQAQAAEMVGVSERTIRDCVRVRNKAPEVFEAVKAGKLRVGGAIDLLDLPPNEQTEILAKVTRGDGEARSGKIKALVRQEKKREVVRRVNSGLVKPMPMGPFGLIVADYAWKFENSDQHEGSRGHLPYPPMEMPEIHAHAGEATKRAGDDCVLGLWVTDTHLPEAFGVIKTWGFAYQGVIVWDKVHVGMGIAGPRHQHELLILAYKGKPQHTLNDITTIIRAPREVWAGHSKKPDLVYELLAKNVAGPRLELFAVGQREGWECWGAEADKPIATERKKKSKILTESDARAAQGAV